VVVHDVLDRADAVEKDRQRRLDAAGLHAPRWLVWHTVCGLPHARSGK
jgi:hypothetical protein